MPPKSTNTGIIHRLTQSIRNSLQNARNIINKHYPAFVGLQIAHHAIVLGSMAVTALYPALSTIATARVDHEIDTTPGGRWITGLYDPETGNTPLAALMTFVVNLTLGAFWTITVPSMIVPWGGLFVQTYRSVLWGMIFSPGFGMRGLKDGQTGYGFWGEVPHYMTLIVEGQAYVVAALGGWIIAKPLVGRVADWWSGKPQEQAKGSAVSEKSEGYGDEEKKVQPRRWTEYKAALSEALSLYSIITAVLAVAAVWEAYEVIHLVPAKK